MDPIDQSPGRLREATSSREPGPKSNACNGCLRCDILLASRQGRRSSCQVPLLRHNDEHQHSGLALYTPAEVFFGRVAAVHAVRQEALDAAYARHPARFPNGPPKAALPPAEVHINPLEALTALVGDAGAAVANINTAPADAPPNTCRRISMPNSNCRPAFPS